MCWGSGACAERGRLGYLSDDWESGSTHASCLDSRTVDANAQAFARSDFPGDEDAALQASRGENDDLTAGIPGSVPRGVKSEYAAQSGALSRRAHR